MKLDLPFGVTPLHIGAVVLVLVALFILSKVFKTKEESTHNAKTRCACGWSGSVSKYKPVCPKCAKPIRLAA